MYIYWKDKWEGRREGRQGGVYDDSSLKNYQHAGCVWTQTKPLLSIRKK